MHELIKQINQNKICGCGRIKESNQAECDFCEEHRQEYDEEHRLMKAESDSICNIYNFESGFCEYFEDEDDNDD